MFLRNLLNVLVQITNNMGLQKKFNPAETRDFVLGNVSYVHLRLSICELNSLDIRLSSRIEMSYARSDTTEMQSNPSSVLI
jgi:hypothetical protein